MSGLGGLNKSPDGVVLGLVQLQLPVVKTPADLARQTEKVCAMVAKAKNGMPTMDLVVFPEYALHGLSMDTNSEIMVHMAGPEVSALLAVCVKRAVWGCFSIKVFGQFRARSLTMSLCRRRTMSLSSGSLRQGL